jgi:GGDEF domain-containing protein
LPLIRQHAFETRLNRTLRAIDAGGLLDPQTGLLTKPAFARDFATAVTQAQAQGGGLLSVARFAFDPDHPRALFDGARIISRLMRRMDFGTREDNGSVIVVFAETDLRSAQAITRRLSAVMRHTSHGRRSARIDPSITVAALKPCDTARTLLARLYDEINRAAS